MKNLTSKQIEVVKQLQVWTSTNFHGNRKQYHGLPVEFVKEIVAKKLRRWSLLHGQQIKESTVSKCRRIANECIRSKDTGYFKILIEGNSNIYLASPIYKHSDYNKSIVMANNEQNRKLMAIVNNILLK